MSVQSFAAQTTQDAFRRVRDKLGSAAVILQVKQSPAGVEVLAARERPRAGLLKLLDGGPIESIETVAEPELPRLGTVEITDESLAGRTQLRLVEEEEAPKTLGSVLSRIEFPSDMSARLTSVAGSGPEAWDRILGWLERVFPTVAVSVKDD